MNENLDAGKDVIISIVGTQIFADDDKDVIELVTDGKYLHKNGETYFSYMESELTGLEGTKTTFSVKPDAVTMSRVGTLNTTMIFEPGKKHYFLYDTPYGAATMSVSTRSVSHELGEHGGDMEIEYLIDLEHTTIGRNNFKINVRESGRQESV